MDLTSLSLQQLLESLELLRSTWVLVKPVLSVKALALVLILTSQRALGSFLSLLAYSLPIVLVQLVSVVSHHWHCSLFHLVLPEQSNTHEQERETSFMVAIIWAKSIKTYMLTTKMQISLCIHAFGSMSLLFTVKIVTSSCYIWHSKTPARLCRWACRF